MIRIRRSEERGRADHGWLDTRHTFSFANYHDPRFMGFRVLRVLNEDRVAPGAGFPRHPHRDMEILSYVLEGAMEHKDSLGNGSVIRPGDVQRMSAGTGVVHSEFNASATEPLHFLQIWILPDQAGLEPSYEERHFPEDARRGLFRVIASGDGREDSVRMNQDVDLFSALLEPGDRVAHTFRMGRHGWLQIARGSALLNGHLLKQGDGAAVENEGRIEVTAEASAEALLFDLP